MQYPSIKYNNPDIYAKYRILKNRKFHKVSFNPAKCFAEIPKAAKLKNNHSNAWFESECMFLI